MTDLPVVNHVKSTLPALVLGRRSIHDIQQSEWSQVISLAIDQGLGPMLFWSARQEDSPGHDQFLLPLQDEARDVALQIALLENACKHLGAALSSEKIPTIWLKGIALAHTVYPEPWLRPMGDLDILVPFHQRSAARKVADGLGFKRLDDDYLGMKDAEDIVRYHDRLVGFAGDSIKLEIHFHLLTPNSGRMLTKDNLSWFWEQTYTIDSPSSDFLILKPEAHLLYLCAHAILRHGEAYLTLLRLLDLHFLVLKNKLNWHSIVDQAILLRWSYAVERALMITSEVFDTSIPDWVLNELRTCRPHDESVSTATSLRVRTANWENWKIIFSKLPPNRRARLVWTTLFPPSTFLRQMYNLEPSQPVFPYYFYRWCDRSLEISRSLQSWLKRSV